MVFLPFFGGKVLGFKRAIFQLWFSETISQIWIQTGCVHSDEAQTETRFTAAVIPSFWIYSSAVIEQILQLQPPGEQRRDHGTQSAAIIFYTLQNLNES